MEFGWNLSLYVNPYMRRSAMGLAEKRATMEFQNNTYPNLKQKIDEAAGFDVPMEIDWTSLAPPNQAAVYQEAWTKIFFEPAIEAFKTICIDDLSKNALKESLKKIEFRNSGQFCDHQGITFAEGVLRVDHELFNFDYVAQRTKAIVKALERAL
jgi:hypothetical protein